MKATALAASAALTLCIISAALAASPANERTSAGGYVAKTERGRLAQQIIRKWAGYVQEVYNTRPMAWSKAMADTFAQADLANLRNAAKRQTFESMNATLSGQAFTDDQAITALAKSDGSKMAIKSFGSTSGDLVYTPINSCRIVDTRLAGGALSANIVRPFISSGTDFTAQGGANNACYIPADPSALVMNVTVLGATGGPGFIRVSPYAISTTAVAVNYVAGQRSSNELIAKMTLGQPFDFQVISGFSTHIVIDVAGYFMASEVPWLNCVSATNVIREIEAGYSGAEFTPHCPTGYHKVAPYCHAATDGAVLTGTGAAFCAWRNPTDSTQIVVEGAQCCRVHFRQQDTR